jgi:hypothetical protein
MGLEAEDQNVIRNSLRFVELAIKALQCRMLYVQ